MATAKLIHLRRNEDLMSEIERLHKVVYDLQDQLSLTQDHLQRSERGVFVNTDAVSRFVKTTSVVMVKSDSNYSTIFLEDGTSILTSKTLKHWEEKFESNDLMRIHNSYLVNVKSINYIDHRSNEVVMKTGCKACYSRSGKLLLKSLG